MLKEGEMRTYYEIYTFIRTTTVWNSNFVSNTSTQTPNTLTHISIYTNRVCALRMGKHMFIICSLHSMHTMQSSYFVTQRYFMECQKQSITPELETHWNFIHQHQLCALCTLPPPSPLNERCENKNKILFYLWTKTMVQIHFPIKWTINRCGHTNDFACCELIS